MLRGRRTIKTRRWAESLGPHPFRIRSGGQKMHVMAGDMRLALDPALIGKKVGLRLGRVLIN
jgi:hypothetical protein